MGKKLFVNKHKKSKCKSAKTCTEMQKAVKGAQMPKSGEPWRETTALPREWTKVGHNSAMGVQVTQGEAKKPMGKRCAKGKTKWC